MGSISGKYTTTTLSTKDPDAKDKIVLSNDAYAICEMLETLINKGLVR